MQYAFALLTLSWTVKRRRWQSHTVLVLTSSIVAWVSVGLLVV